MTRVAESIGWLRERAAIAAADDETRFLALLNAFGRLNRGQHGIRGDRILPVSPPPVPLAVPAQRKPSPAERARDAQIRFGRRR